MEFAPNNVANLESTTLVGSVFADMGIIGYLLCAVAFLGLLLLVAVSRASWRRKWLLAVACLITALWAAALAGSVALSSAASPALPPHAIEGLRNLGWLFFLGQLLRLNRHERRGERFTLTVFFTVGVAAVAPILAFDVMLILDALPQMRHQFALSVRIAQVVLAVLGLLLVENLFRNADEEGRWTVKHLCFGLGTLFGYDFFLYADAVLFQRLDENLFVARGFVDALVVPLIGISVGRLRAWELELHLSRRIVFHSAALIGSGLYLVLMSGVGYLIILIDRTWGPVLQIMFLIGALLVTVLLFSSTAVRSHIRVWISKHFFRYTHDYREIWLRFTRTVSENPQGRSLSERIVRAVADMVDCTASGLWVYREADRAFLPAAKWHMAGPLVGEAFPGLPADAPMIRYLRDTEWVVDLSDYRRDPNRYEGLAPPDWLLTHPRALIVLPLFHRDQLWAFLVLGEPRTRVHLDWETRDLLKTVGRQAASYLAEEHALFVLSDARRLEAFNRRSAFIVHDIKNLVSQMSLMLQNAEKFGNDPEFQKDMLLTVKNSVARMKELLAQFKAVNADEASGAETAPERGPAVASVDAGALLTVGEVVDRIARDWRKQKPDLNVAVDRTATRRVDGEKLSSALNHLLQNAIEAAGQNGRVALSLRRAGADQVVEVADDGQGMDPEFVRDKLFRPLETAKDAGYGLGAFQTRQIITEMGGRLEVVTSPGQGTKMQIVLPAS